MSSDIPGSLPTDLKSKLASGVDVRRDTPFAKQGKWRPSSDRADPVDLIEKSNDDRLPNLIPVRNSRMLTSPLAFYRGAAIIMAADLATTVTTGINVQACGDCHLQNFGWFATPERNLAFDVTDFDETYHAPWEWDIKRLATSFAIAAKELTRPASATQCADAAVAVTEAYRMRMGEFALMDTMSVWQFRLDATRLIAEASTPPQKKAYKLIVAKAQQQTGERLLRKLTEKTKDGLRIVDKESLTFHDPNQNDHLKFIKDFLKSYADNLTDDRRVLFHRFKLADVAFKVVGVGSVGLRCEIALLLDSSSYPLILQIKEARKSVLESYVDKKPDVKSQSHRVALGQRLSQAATDPFLGWGRGEDGRDYYVRQLRDMKVSVDITAMTYANLIDHARLCGWALARSHAKSGAGIEIAGYLGKSDKFDRKIAKFAVEYQQQNKADYLAFKQAIAEGRLQSV